jgi:two-component system CheB/CheR fusion protein
MTESPPSEYRDLRPDHHPVPVVAIGASAGGVQAAKELFSFLPADTGLGFVYIQHLSPTFDSQLDQVIMAATVMPVYQA